MKDCDPADGTPAACIVASRDAPGPCAAGGARLDIVRSVERRRLGIVGTMSNPARPEERQKYSGSGVSACLGEREMPACSMPL